MRHSRFHDVRFCLALLQLLVACRAAPVAAPGVARLTLSPIDADVWSTYLQIRGEITGPFAPSHCDIATGQQRRPGLLQGARFDVAITLALGANVVRGRCVDARGRILESEPVTYRKRTFREAQTQESTQASTANWLDGAVLYGILPPLYGNPPLKAAMDALPALAELGVNAVWLPPVMATPPGNFGYAVTDYFAVRTDYGTPADLSAFVGRAHALGLRVIFDFVPNHTSDEHPYFVQAEQYGERSHYFHFYMRDSRGTSEHYFDWKDLPNLDYSNLEVQAFISEASQSWLEAYANDGYRMDAVWGIAQRQPGFLLPWVRRMRVVQPSIVLIAEASARDPIYRANGFDAAYDWIGELGHWAWAEAFSSSDGIAVRLRHALDETQRAKARSRIVRFLNNNDTGLRFVTRHGVGLTRAATVLLLTLPGVPCLYSLDEVGGEFEPYRSVGAFAGKTHPELRDLHRTLIELRHRINALRGDGFELLDATNSGVLAYLRSAHDRTDQVLVIINFTSATQIVRLVRNLPFRSKTLANLAGTSGVARSPDLAPLSLPAFGYAILADADAGAVGRD